MDGQYLSPEEANYSEAPSHLGLNDDNNCEIQSHEGLLQWDQSDDDDWGDFAGHNIEEMLHRSFSEKSQKDVLSHGHSSVRIEKEEEPLNKQENPYSTMQASSQGSVNLELGHITEASKSLEYAKVEDPLRSPITYRKSVPDAEHSDIDSAPQMRRSSVAYTVPHLSLKQNIDMSALVFQAGNNSYSIVLKKHTARWYGYLTLLSLRLLMLVVLCTVTLVTLSKMGKAVTCIDVHNCDNGGGIMAFPWLLHVDKLYDSASNDYTAITVHLSLFTIMMILTVGVSIFFLVEFIRKGTSKYYKSNLSISAICALFCAVASTGFYSPVILTHSFCNIEQSILMLGDDVDKYSDLLAGSRNMCTMFSYSIGCFICALLCSLTVLILPMCKLSKFWNTSLVFGYLKFIFGSFLLFLAIYFGTQSRAYNLQEYAFERKQFANDERVPIDVEGQFELYFATIQWAGYILAFFNVCCGAFSYFGAWLQSHFFNVINIIVNFVFFFVNGVASLGLLFNDATVNFACQYAGYPVSQSMESTFFSNTTCACRLALTSTMVFVFLEVLLYLSDFFISIIIFSREFCSNKDVMKGA